jgi:hypothetical protein
MHGDERDVKDDDFYVGFYNSFYKNKYTVIVPCPDHTGKSGRNGVAQRPNVMPSSENDNSVSIFDFGKARVAVDSYLNIGDRASFNTEISNRPFEAVDSSYDKMKVQEMYELFAPSMQRAFGDIIKLKEKIDIKTKEDKDFIESLKRFKIYQKTFDDFFTICKGLDIDKCSKKGSLTVRSADTIKKISYHDVRELNILRSLPRMLKGIDELIDNNPDLGLNTNRLSGTTLESIGRLAHGLASYVIHMTSENGLGKKKHYL